METILVADDNRMNRMIFESMLKKIANFKVVLAENGQDAIDKFIQEQPKFILMDIHMPIINGIDATKIIRKIESNKEYKTIIIGLSMNLLDNIREKCTYAGMDNFLIGPFLSEDLARVLLGK